jgi:hypothetical protein
VPTPIHVQGSTDEVNLKAFPWDEPDVEAACTRFAQRRLGETGCSENAGPNDDAVRPLRG